MSPYRFRIACFTISGIILFLSTAPARGGLQAVGLDESTGIASAVVVENSALAHTALILPWDANGQITASSPEDQAALAVRNLSVILSAAGSSPEHIVRLNLYVSSQLEISSAWNLLRPLLGESVRPTVTAVVSPLPDAHTLLGLDVVALVPESNAPAKVERLLIPSLPAVAGAAHVAILPRGRTLYISGMADAVDDLEKATAGTMAQLQTVLALNGLGTEHVVQLKAFLKPMDRAASACVAMASPFVNQTPPPMALVEWTNGLPIEIELIAHMPDANNGGEPVQHLWPEGESRSPVYCRYAIVGSPTRIYTRGFLPDAGLDAEEQVRSIFSQLEAALAPLDSTLHHLVKATYYVSAEDTSSALNTVRPDYYDPEHPPAASKASIAGTGSTGQNIVIDMIAVPR